MLAPGRVARAAWAPDAQARQQLAEECRDKIMGRLTEEAERLELRADMPLATDWLNGRRNPYPAPELTGTLTGLRLSTTAPRNILRIGRSDGRSPRRRSSTT